MLRRGGGSEPARRAAGRGESGERRESTRWERPSASAEWQLGGDLGRRYAAVSGDRNPIHMHALSARSRSASRGRSRTGCGPRRAAWRRSRAACPTPSRSTCSFRKPILLPGRVEFASTQRRRDRFAVRDAKRGTPHLDGRVEPIEAKPNDGRKYEMPPPLRTRAWPSAAWASACARSNALAGSDLLDRIGIRKPAERVLFTAHARRLPLGDRRRPHVQGGAEAGASRPARRRASRAALFDLTPTTSSRCCRRRARRSPRRSCARPRRRPTPTATTPAELLAQADELGVTMLGVPEELGGVVHERSAVTGVLVGEALAHGDMGLAVARARARRRRDRARPLGRRRPAGDLPARVHRRGHARRGAGDPRAARRCSTRSQLRDDGAPRRRRLGARRRQVAGRRAPTSAELLRRRRRGRGHGPALFVVESGDRGPLGRGRAGDGRCAPPPPAACCSRASRCPAARCSARASPTAYAECVQRARLAWCALAVGTAQAVLDYVIPYVNERVAFGEPISNRQAVAFTVSDIAIELEGMRLAT